MRQAPEINSGSMADIAFLLLIFFLVTTTIADDVGFNRKLPKLCPTGEDCSAIIIERNILSISLNNNQKIMVNTQVVALAELKDITKIFLDNNGDTSCGLLPWFKSVNFIGESNKSHNLSSK